MTENFEYFTVKFIEFHHNLENLQQKLKAEENKILSANIFLNEILNFDLISAFSDLMEFNKKLWSKVLYGNFDKIEFDSLNKFFAENFKRLNSNKITELKNLICNLENENKVLKSELQKVLFAKKGVNASEKIRNIINASLLKHKEIMSNKSKNEFSVVNNNNNDKSFNSHNSLKSSFRKKNHSKSFFIGNKAPKSNNKNNATKNNNNNNNIKSVKESSDKDSSFSNNNVNKDFLDKSSFNKLIINPSLESNQKQGTVYNSNSLMNDQSYLVSNSNNKYLFNNYNNESNSITYKNPANNDFYYTTYNRTAELQSTDVEQKTMLNSILDKYKNENTNNITTNNISGNNPLSINSNTSIIRLQSRYINPYAPVNSESNKESYSNNYNNLANNAYNLPLVGNFNKVNSRYYSENTYSSNNNYYNTMTNIHENTGYNSNNEIINNKNANKEINKWALDYINYYDIKNTQMHNNQFNENKTEIKNQTNQISSNIKNKIAEGSVNDETFGDNKTGKEKDSNTNRIIKLSDHNINCANLIENNKDFSVLSSSLVIDNQDMISNINKKEPKENDLKKTKSFSRLKIANQDTEINNNKKHTSKIFFLNHNLNYFTNKKKIFKI